LGLAISRTLVYLLGGDIDFESEHGQGSRFWFHLPLAASAAPSVQEHASNQPLHTRSVPWRFLIVDDHPVNRLLARQVLKNAWPDSVIEEAGDGQQALDVLQTRAFDLVLMDMVMPVMDGIEATQWIRQQLPMPAQNVVILGLTANVNPVDLEAFKSKGLNDVMLKPFVPEHMCAKVEHWLLYRE
jgi:CheY-like chemotaxis protein